jgi:hypothetical protein
VTRLRRQPGQQTAGPGPGDGGLPR